MQAIDINAACQWLPLTNTPCNPKATRGVLSFSASTVELHRVNMERCMPSITIKHAAG